MNTEHPKTSVRWRHAYDTQAVILPRLKRIEDLIRKLRRDPRILEDSPASHRLGHQIERLKRIAAPLWHARYVQVSAHYHD